MARVVQVKTSAGDFAIELYDKDSPAACQYFIDTISGEFYRDTTIHRVISDYVVQFGTRAQEDTELPKLKVTEITPQLKHTGAGVVALMVHEQQLSGSFYITLAPLPTMDLKHVIIGRVCDGMQTIKRISAVQTLGDTGVPQLSIQVTTIFLNKK